MKKIKKYLIIILSIVMVYTLTVTVYGSENNIYVTKEEYFSNLKENFGHNSEGTCTIVALEMMLLYYDTFVNDNIVPEQYEVKSNTKNNSPGSLNDQYLYNSSYSSYEEYINTYKDISLHAKLLYLNNINNENKGFILSVNSYETLLNLYFSEIGFIEYIDYNIISVHKNDCNIEEFIINNINNGDIVLTSIEEREDADNPNSLAIGSHSLIAYEYTDETIYMNYGYRSGTVNTSREDLSVVNSNNEVRQYNEYTRAMTINFNLNHVHSDNYKITNNSLEHRIVCPCGYNEYENHKFDVEENNKGICVDCKNEQTVSFDATIIPDPDSATNCGTYVNLYGGLYRGTDILPGFTRLLYLDYSSPSHSRLDYNWYSSDEDVAIVTKYGTLVGVSPGTCKIYAYLKTDPTRLGVITITTLRETLDKNYKIEVTTDIKEISYENGTEVTELKQSPNLFTIHSGYSRVLCFCSQNMYPSINDFVLNVSNDSVYITNYGTIIANEVIEETPVLVYGYHKNNRNIIINQEFIILPLT